MEDATESQDVINLNEQKVSVQLSSLSLESEIKWKLFSGQHLLFACYHDKDILCRTLPLAL